MGGSLQSLHSWALSRPHLPLSAEMSWRSTGIEEVVVVWVGWVGVPHLTLSYLASFEGGWGDDRTSKTNRPEVWSDPRCRSKTNQNSGKGWRTERNQQKTKQKSDMERWKESERWEGGQREEEEERNTPPCRCAHYSMLGWIACHQPSPKLIRVKEREEEEEEEGRLKRERVCFLTSPIAAGKDNSRQNPCANKPRDTSSLFPMETASNTCLHIQGLVCTLPQTSRWGNISRLPTA